jgi:rhamnose transport system permease protein
VRFSAILLVIAAALAAIFSPRILDIHYLLDKSTLFTGTGLVALAMTLVIISGNIDLSVGSNVALTGCVAAKLLQAGYPPIAVVLLGLLTGTFLGALNGVMVAGFRLPSFLVTLGTMAAYRGAAQAMVGANSVKVPEGFTGIQRQLLALVPAPVVVFIVMAILTGLLLHRTVFGRWVVSIGTNESASRYAGVPVERTKIVTFALAGLMAGLAALMEISQLEVARFDLAKGMELDAITMAVVGGCAITGGKGTIGGTVSALILVMLMKTAMGVANVKAEYQLTAIGVLLLLAVLVGRLDSHQPAKPGKSPTKAA